jgi:hypothetical protein
MNYTQLKEQIWAYLQTDNDGLGGTLTDNTTMTDTIIRQAEERIVRSVQLPYFRKNVTGNATTNNQYLAAPSDFLSAYSLAVIVAGEQTYLLPKDVAFIREAYPQATPPLGSTQVPRYYALFDENTLLLGPTPTDNYGMELHYYYEPASIVDTGTSWLGDNAENALLYGCLVEAYTVLKGEADLMTMYAERYNDAITQLKTLGEGRDRSDTYRNGESRIKPN